MGNLQAARERYVEALAVFRALENDAWSAMTLDDLALVEFDDGDPERALRLAGEALEIKLRGKHAVALAVNYTNSAAYRIALGEFGPARESALQGLRWAQHVQDHVRVADAIEHLAACAAFGGDVRRASRLMGFVTAQYEAAGREHEATDLCSCEKVASASRKLLSETEIARLAAEGSLWTEEQAVAPATLE